LLGQCRRRELLRQPQEGAGARLLVCRTEAYDTITQYIDHYYNTRRRHSTIGHVTPSRFESTVTLKLAA
jgi:transposase InsO family protein